MAVVKEIPPAMRHPHERHSLRRQERFLEIEDGDLFKQGEHKVLNLLIAAWNAFVLLPIEHGDDLDEFRQAIHAAQEKILARPGRRFLNRGVEE